MDPVTTNNEGDVGNVPTRPIKGHIKKRNIALLVLVVFVIVAAVYLFLNKETEEEKQLKEITEVVEKVKNHILITEEELPLMATVVDAEALSAEQLFYRGVSNGDKILIFVQTQRAIIYNPEDDIIVNVGPVVNTDTDSLQGTSAEI